MSVSGRSMRSDGSAERKGSSSISTLGGGGAHEYKGQFLQAVSSRKVVERDAALLANRIKLLRQEEAKAWKKIKQTRARADQIIALRKEHEERVRERERRMAEDEKRPSAERERHAMSKEVSVLQRKENERKVMEGKRRSVKQVKAMSREAAREITRRREEERARALANKEDIRRRHREQQEKKKKAKAKQLARNRELYAQRVAEEEARRREEEERVRKLEEEENQLIDRLRRATTVQEREYGALESTIHGGSPSRQ